MKGHEQLTRVLLPLALLSLALGSGCRAGAFDPYEPCFSSSDCSLSSDGCFRLDVSSAGDAICSRSCSVDSQCSFDSRGNLGACLDFGGFTGPMCFERCFSSIDCASGYSCQSTSAGINVCLPGSAPPPVGAAPYDDCSSSADCDTRSGGCVTISAPWPTGTASDQICTSSCFDDNDCPFDVRGGRGACLSFDGGVTATCFERCRNSADCRSTFVCTDMVGGTSFTNICLPM